MGNYIPPYKYEGPQIFTILPGEEKYPCEIQVNLPVCIRVRLETLRKNHNFLHDDKNVDLLTVVNIVNNFRDFKFEFAAGFILWWEKKGGIIVDCRTLCTLGSLICDLCDREKIIACHLNNPSKTLLCRSFSQMEHEILSRP
jgi:hypothetical protein